MFFWDFITTVSTQTFTSIPVMIITCISTLLNIFVTLAMLWQVYVGVHGFAPVKPKKKQLEKQHKFAVVICARNEEAVIGQLLDSLEKQEYPREKFDIFVVADNCTDNTAKVAAQYGATVYERFNDKEVGKGFALRMALDRILKEYAGCYDAVTVFDADNLADSRYLYHTNEALCSGADATQGYRETKNPYDRVVSGCYAVYWYMMSRFYHHARSRKGIPCQIGGTGFSFKMKMIEKEGWVTQTLAEDSEFASRKVLEGYHIEFVREALFYDEQPTTWKASVKQRLRWMVGTMQVAKLLLGPSFRAWRGGNKNAFDIMMLMLSVPAMALGLVNGVLSIVNSAFLASYMPDQALWIMGGSLVSFFGGMYLSTFVLGLLSTVLEKRKIGRLWPAVIMYPLFMAPVMVLTLIGFFKKKVVWEPIAHDSRVTISDMNSHT